MSEEVNSKVTYLGSKMINAEPMSRADYNDFRGWELPEDENGADEGYLVEYLDGGEPNTLAYAGYVSWSPKEQFENAYREVSGLSFGMAIEAMKKGMKVARAGWNGKGMFCIYVPGTRNVELNKNSPYYAALNDASNGQSHVEILPHFDMYTVNAEGRRAFLPGWLASQSDMNADDWAII